MPDTTSGSDANVDADDADQADAARRSATAEPPRSDPAGRQSTAASGPTTTPTWRTWLLVAAVFVAFLVVPGVILFLPAARPVIAALGLTQRDAYLVLPLVPALLLGAMAVWSGLAARRRAD